MGTAHDNWLTKPLEASDAAACASQAACLAQCDIDRCERCSAEGCLHRPDCHLFGEENPDTMQPLEEVEPADGIRVLCASCSRAVEEEDCDA